MGPVGDIEFTCSGTGGYASDIGDIRRARINEALSDARRLKHVYTLAEVLAVACLMEWMASWPREAKEHAKELVDLSEEHGFPHWVGLGIFHIGWSLTALGQAQEGLPLITKGISMFRATRSVNITPNALMSLAEAYAKLGCPAEGLNRLAEAAQLIEATDGRNCEAELHRLRGDLLNATGDRVAAERSYRQALVVAGGQNAKLFELRVATSLARLWRDQGKHREAHDLLASIYSWFTEGFDTPVLREAQVLLEQLTA